MWAIYFLQELPTRALWGILGHISESGSNLKLFHGFGCSVLNLFRDMNRMFDWISDRWLLYIHI